ncbi:MAG: carbohydrate-binding family 6 protein [Acidobacteria bacterium]|nr:carbohydrate-binding family 6 protein [Acidobacteriota bacterium]
MVRVTILLLACGCAAVGQTASILYDARSGPVRFAAGEIRAALTRKGISAAEGQCCSGPGPLKIVLAAGAGEVAAALQAFPAAAAKASGAQAYAVRRAGAGTYLVLGADAAGAMYGGLEIAESIRIGALEETRDSDAAPRIAQRGIKFNIPLDVRTPSYSDNSDPAQANIGEMWSLEFWRTLLDEMARHRYNVLSLWSLHPFPSIVKVPEYPEVALADVKRTTVPMDDSYSHNGTDMVRPALLERMETLRRMTIEEKIDFWRTVMQYAKDRGIDTYWFTWNMFVYGAEGKHGITGAQDNPVTLDYFRKSVRETVLTYPLLAGMGITAGERMENRKDEFGREKWLWKAYGEGVRDALKQQPGREFRMIHRFHQTGLEEIQREWKEYPGPLDVSFKYSIAHMYSAVKPPYLEGALPYLSPKLRTWLTVRNDDIYSFRWGDAEYARAYVKNIPGPDKVAGFYMGPDGFIWGRDYLSRDGGAAPELVMQKQWYSFLLWGRLSYDPELSDVRLRRIVGARFPEVPAEALVAAWASASKVFPEITRFFWGDIDLRWFPEACLSHRRHKGYYTVRHFIEGETMPGSGNLDILTWRERVLEKQEMGGTTPLEVAAALKKNAGDALARLPELRKPAGADREARLTLGDIEAMAHLGNYYAEKILGAAELALFDGTGEAVRREAAVKHLNAAADHWRRYAGVYGAQYKPQLLNRVGYVDIPALGAKADEDVAMARAWKAGTLPKRAGKAGADVPFKK